MAARVLVVDDEDILCEALARGLSALGFDTKAELSAEAALHVAADEELDAVVTDVVMSGMNGLELCQRLHESRPELPVIIMTALGNQDAAVAALRAGAYDFLPKPVEIEALTDAVRRAVAYRRERAELERLPAALLAPSEVPALVGHCAGIRRLRRQIGEVASADAAVLVRGESGTGKEVVARALHERSHRAGGPFVALNCAAIPEGLLESQLFGHVEGAFTDARRTQPGLLQQANGGTLFLDEIGEMPMPLQAKLLRAVEHRRVRPVGALAEVSFDARLVSATNRDLEAAVRQRLFRKDLYYRLNVVELELPPLRQRGEDVLLLAQCFVEAFAALTGKAVQGFSSGVAQVLRRHRWPGNVRELQNVVHHAVLLTRHRQLTVEDLPLAVRQGRGLELVPLPETVIRAVSEQHRGGTDLRSLEQVERAHILHVLEAVAGNRSMAARVLGLDRRTLYRKLRSYGVPRGGLELPSSGKADDEE